jgi:hypothetical protein
MKTSIKFATGLILVAAALVASGSAAHAGEGGAAGSVSIKFTNATDVTRLSTSVAVGKNYGVAVARTDAANGNTATSAAGAGGGFTLTGANSAAPAYTVTAETPAGIIINQANTFAGSGATTLKPGTGVTLAD